MKKFTSLMRKCFSVSVALLLILAVVLPVGVVYAAVSEKSQISDYVCDFENGYNKPYSGRVAIINGRKALNFKVLSNATTHFFEIANPDKDDFKLTHGNVYSVKIDYKVERVAKEVYSETMTTINLVRYSAESNEIVKIKTFQNAAFVPGDTTDWITATIVFKASIADSPEFDRLAINVISPTCSSSGANSDKSMTSVWFDDIVITECKGTTSAIEFESNGGTYCDVIMAQSGETISLPKPKRELYDFAGWYKDSALTKKYTSTKMPSGLITKLYAKWTVSKSSIKISFANTYGETFDTMIGKAGSSVELPTPTRAGYHFGGWYTDKAYTNKFNQTTFPKSSVTLYAKWEELSFFSGFENRKAYGNPDDGQFSRRCEILSGTASHGSSAMYYDFMKGKDTSSSKYRSLGTVIIRNESGKTFRAQAGKTYVVTFKYKVEEVSYDGSFGIVASAEGSAWSNRKVQVEGYSSASVKYTSKDIGKGWQTGSITFTCNPQSNDPNNAHIGLGIAGNAKLWVDDIFIYEKNVANGGKCMLAFNSNGGTHCDTIYGSLDQAIKMPKNPVRPGYTFAGWYTDDNLVTPFNTENVSFNNGCTSLYAGWILIPVESEEDEIIDIEEPELEEPELDGFEQEEPKAEESSTNENQDQPKEDGIPLQYIIIGAIAGTLVIAVVVVVIVISAKKRKKKKLEN